MQAKTGKIVVEKLIAKLETSITTLEITPPKSTHLDEVLDSVAKISKLSLIDGFTVTDKIYGFHKEPPFIDM